MLIPGIGVKATIVSAAIASIGVGVTALIFNKNLPINQSGQKRRETKDEGRRTRGEGRGMRDGRLILTVVLIAFAFSGFTGWSFEVLWSRVLVMVLGTSVYAFSTMLTTFLFGIALGSYLFARIIDKRKDLLMLFAVVEVAIGISVILLTPLLGKLPFVFLKMFQLFGGAWSGIVFMQFFISALVMIIPTILFGATFPIVSKIYTRRMEKLGRSIGNVYAVNTLGAIGGSFAAGFIFIPWLGIQKTIVAVCFINVIVGLVMVGINKNLRLKLRWASIPLTGLVIFPLALTMPAWDRGVMDSGVYVYAQNLLNDPLARNPLEVMHMHDKELLFYKEGVYATVSVYKGKYLFMRISGKTDASTSPDMMTQHLVAHLPLLFHKNPKTALVIGLASGTSLGSALKYPLTEVDCAEISPEVVEASSFFNEANHNALADPRVNLHIVDGRNFVMATDKKYDVIISEPSNPWISGVSNLFTQEFYKLCAEKLNKGGLICQWFQVYHMSPEDVKTEINTFLSVFPNVTVWSPTMGREPMADILMVGSKEDFTIDFKLLNERFHDVTIREDMAYININGPFDILSCYLMGGNELYRRLAYHAVNTDNQPIIEFNAPKDLYSEVEVEVINTMKEGAGCGFPPLYNFEMLKGGVLELHFKMAVAYFYRGKYLMAIEEFGDCIEIDPGFVQARYFKAMSAHQLEMNDEAVREWRKIIEIAPASEEAEKSRLQLKEHELAKGNTASQVKPVPYHPIEGGR